jgi:hypothetical protein
MLRRFLLVVFILSVAGGLLTGCGSTSPASANDRELKLAPMAMMPAEVQSAPLVTQQAYQFAVANPDVTQHIPCYCGCGAMGHTSNYACYVESAEADTVKFDLHAIGCSICVDITQDAMRLTKEGQSPQQIKTYVDKTYSRFGPTNMP